MIYFHFSEYSSPDTLLHLYERIAQPHLEYASQVLGPIPPAKFLRESKNLHSGCVKREFTFNCLSYQQGDFICVRDPNSAHEMSELNYYNLQQSYTTELKNTINSHAIYIP